MRLHYTHYCPKLVDTDITYRKKITRRIGFCYNCLKSNHSTEKRHTRTCKKCEQRHHTILHTDTQESIQMTQAPTKTLNVVKQAPTTTLNAIKQAPTTTPNLINVPSEVLLSFALINIAEKQGSFHTCRILLDSEFQSHFMTDKLVTILA